MEFDMYGKKSMKWLQHLARIKVGISHFSEALFRRIAKPSQETKIEDLGDESQCRQLNMLLYANNREQKALHKFFLKELFRHGGFTWVQELCNIELFSKAIIGESSVFDKIKKV